MLQTLRYIDTAFKRSMTLGEWLQSLTKDYNCLEGYNSSHAWLWYFMKGWMCVYKWHYQKEKEKGELEICKTVNWAKTNKNSNGIVIVIIFNFDLIYSCFAMLECSLGRFWIG